LLGLGVVRWHPWDALGAGASRESAVTLPDRDVAKAWQGLAVLDPDGEQLGECTGVFADAASGATQWLEVAVQGHRRCLVPALNALEVAGRVRVAFGRAAVLSAPQVGDDTKLSKQDDIALYRHYQVPYSASASPSLLPTEADLNQPKTAELPVTPTEGADRDTPPGPQTAELPVTPTATADRNAPTQPQPTPSVFTPQPPLQEADTSPYTVQRRTPIRRPAPAAPGPVQAVPTSPVSPATTEGSASPEASPAPTPSPGPQSAANDPPVAVPEPMPAPVPPKPPVHSPGATGPAGWRWQGWRRRPRSRSTDGRVAGPSRQTRQRYRSSREQYRSIQRQVTELARHPRVQHYRQAVTDPQTRQQALAELKAHPQVQHYQRAVTDPQVRQQVLTELRDKADAVAAGLKKRLG